MRVKKGRAKCPTCLCGVCVNGGVDMFYPFQGPTPNEVNCLEFGTIKIPGKCPIFEPRNSDSAQPKEEGLRAA